MKIPMTRIPTAVRGATGGATQKAAMTVLKGGGARVGMEDNIYYAPGELLKSNAQMVERAVRIIRELGMEVATPDEAREILKLGR